MSERELIDLVRELPVEVPGPSEARRLENQLFIRAQLTPQHPAPVRPASRARTFWAIAASVLFTAFVGRAIWTTEPAELDDTPYGVVRATEGASFSRDLRVHGASREEVVQLDHGTLLVRVRKLRPGDRFLVQCGGSEVEVRGTRFEVSAVDGQLARVAVDEGRVEVRTKSEASRMLLPGDVWYQTRFDRPTRWRRASIPAPEGMRRPVPRAMVPPSPPSASVGEPELPQTSSRAVERIDVLEELLAEKQKPSAGNEKRDRAPPVSPRLPRQDVEAAFMRAWQLHKRGQFDQAAELFRRVIDSGEDHDIVEDASYWLTMSLEAAGQIAKAIESAEAYVARFPNASRREAVELRWAWLELGLGHAESAQLRFTKLLASTHEAVRREARAGLDSMSRSAEEKWPDEVND